MIRQTLEELTELTCKGGNSEYLSEIVKLVDSSMEVVKIIIREGVTDGDCSEEKEEYLKEIQENLKVINYLCELNKLQQIPETDLETLAFAIINSFRPK